MKYPVLADWIRFKQISENEYEVINLLYDEKFRTDAYTVWFISQLDSETDPYKTDERNSREYVESLLKELKKKNVIRDKRLLSKSLMSLFITLWKPRVTTQLRLLSFFINGLLLISWLPLLGFAAYHFLYSSSFISTDYITAGCVAGLIVGLIMHELGHMLACLAYGGRVFEVGVFFQFFMPGAYVLMNESNIKSRMKKVQIMAAGIEMNLLLAAVCLVLSVSYEPLSGFFLGAAIQNIFLALLNLTFVNGFDGMQIISELLGVEEFADKAKKLTESNLQKNRLRKNGMAGRATVVLCYTVRAIQIALPLMLILNIVEVVSCFL